MTLPVLRSRRLHHGDGGGSDPFHELAVLQQRMGQLMTAMLGTDSGIDPGTGRLTGTGLLGTGMWTPLADVTETDEAYLVEIDVPGVNRKDLTVDIAGTELRVAGEIVEKEKVGWLLRRTRRVGQFAYRTTLPADVDADHVTADLAGGVLTVRVPKLEAAKPRRITVNAA